MTDSGKPLKLWKTHAGSHAMRMQVTVGKGIYLSQALPKTHPLRRIANRKSQFTFLDVRAIYVSAASII
jgi:hypothetical protein